MIFRQVGKAKSDFAKQAYVVKYLIRIARQVNKIPKYLISYVNSPLVKFSENDFYLTFSLCSMVFCAPYGKNVSAKFSRL